MPVLTRHAQLLTHSPIAALLSLYVATIYGILYLLFTTIPAVFSDIYAWDVSIAGLAYTPRTSPTVDLSSSSSADQQSASAWCCPCSS